MAICVAFVTLLAAAQSNSDDHLWVVRASTEHQPSRFAYRRNAMRKYGLYKGPTGPPPAPDSSSPRAALDEDTITGSVTRVLRSGLTLNTFISTHSRPKAIQQLIDSQIEKYTTQYGKDAVTVKRSGDAVSIYTDGGSWNEGGTTFSSPAWENHYRFNNGVFATAAGLDTRRHLRGLDFEALKSALLSSKGKDSYVRYLPDSSDAARIERFRKTFSVRRTFGFPPQLDWLVSDETGARLEPYFKDIQSAEMWTKLPKEGSPYVLELTLQARPDSPLAKLLSGLRPATLIRPAQSEAIGQAIVNLRVSDEIRFLVEDVVANILPGDSLLADALTSQDSLAITCLLGGPEPATVLRGQAFVSIASSDLMDLVRALQDVKPSDSGVSAIVTPTFVGQEFDKQRVQFVSKDKQLLFALGPVGTPVLPGADATTTAATKGDITVAELALDLADWIKADEDSAVDKLVHGLETVFMRGWVRARTIEQLRERGADPNNFEDINYRSLRARAKATGDWRVQFSVTVNPSGRLKVRCSVGQELHEFIMVRANTLE